MLAAAMSASTAGIIGIAAGALALIGLAVSILLARRFGRVLDAHAVVTDEGERGMIEHAAELDRRLASLGEEVRAAVARLDGSDAALAERLDGAIARCAVVRYDAMGEMTGRQSSSVALLDSHLTGVVLSSILHREQARLYAKPIVEGRSEFDLSPEEQQALERAAAATAG
jgi:hypothetical protein